MEVGGLFAVPTWHLFIRRNPGFILFIMPSLGPRERDLDLDRTPGYGLGYGWGTVGVRVGYGWGTGGVH